ncbi:hypothetical protein LCGC14_1644880 [marine sediment metagenome]|uniref:Uncharacterized protein n=1 Tax=marine sediment metagenome TaxID=412755 RepID=A0A0F9KYD2_9ZZZZ
MVQSESGITHQELAYSILVLERQLEAYRRLYEEEMAAMHQTLNEIKNRILTVGEQQIPVKLQVDSAGKQE